VIFHETPLAGVVVVEAEPIADERGSFARTFDADEFERRGLNPRVAQANVSSNVRAGTLRGMHYQREPWRECKLVRCTRGAIYDVALDLRPESETFGRWHAVELSEDNRLALYVPEGFAHGFQTLTDATEVAYQISQVYVPDAAAGVRWDDERFGIKWPEAAVRVMSERDRTYPDFVE